MEPMTPFVAIGGGLLIGTAAALLLLLSGRIAGVSGMIATSESSVAHANSTPNIAAAIARITLSVRRR